MCPRFSALLSVKADLIQVQIIFGRHVVVELRAKILSGLAFIKAQLSLLMNSYLELTLRTKRTSNGLWLK